MVLSTMSDGRSEDAKRTILQGIEALLPVAEYRKDKHARSGLLAQAASLNNLGERIELHLLPEGLIRSVINDARLDTLLILTDLKVSLTFEKQELAAPTEKLRLEVHERRIGIDEDHNLAPEVRGVSPRQQLSEVVSKLRVLDSVEQSLRNCLL